MNFKCQGRVIAKVKGNRKKSRHLGKIESEKCSDSDQVTFRVAVLEQGCWIQFSTYFWPGKDCVM